MIPLYRSDPYLASCETVIDRVISVESGTAIFCREALFLEGGGQPMDHGAITIRGERFPLLKIIKEKGNTGYVISGAARCERGDPACCELDMDRRYRTMRLHSAQHALAGSLRSVRDSILTGGMKISDPADECAVLYPVSSLLLDTELDRALEKLSESIAEDCAVRSESVTSESEAMTKYGRLYRPTVASGSLKGSFRIVIIEGLDANACGGTHVRRLGEVGGIRVTAVRGVESGREIIFTLSDL